MQQLSFIFELKSGDQAEMITRKQKRFLLFAEQLQAQIVVEEQKSSFEKHVMADLYFALLCENGLIEAHLDLFAFDYVAFEEYPVQPHLSSLEAPINFVDKAILCRVKCVSWIVFQVIESQPRIKHMMRLKNRFLSLVMKVHIALKDSIRDKFIVSFEILHQIVELSLSPF